MKRTATWSRKNGGYEVRMPGVRAVTIWFSSAMQLKAFAIANDVVLKEVKPWRHLA